MTRRYEEYATSLAIFTYVAVFVGFAISVYLVYVVYQRTLRNTLREQEELSDVAQAVCATLKDPANTALFTTALGADTLQSVVTRCDTLS